MSSALSPARLDGHLDGPLAPPVTPAPSPAPSRRVRIGRCVTAFAAQAATGTTQPPTALAADEHAVTRLARLLGRLTLVARQHLLANASRLRHGRPAATATTHAPTAPASTRAAPAVVVSPSTVLTGPVTPVPTAGVTDNDATGEAGDVVASPRRLRRVRAVTSVSTAEWAGPEIARDEAHQRAVEAVQVVTTPEVPGYAITHTHGVVMATAYLKDSVPWDAVLTRIKVAAVKAGGNSVVGLVASHAASPTGISGEGRLYSVLLMGTAASVVVLDATHVASEREQLAAQRAALEAAQRDTVRSRRELAAHQAAHPPALRAAGP